MVKLYQLLSYLFLPVIIFNLYLRIFRKKEDRKRYSERFGKSNSRFTLDRKVIWIHAASIGEFKATDLIIENFYQNFNILVTTTTKTSAEYVAKYYDNKVIHQYIPFDIPSWCINFLNYWNPKLILWIESDIWPNMLSKIKDKNIKCYYLNARISPKSFRRWKYFNNLYSISLNTFNKIYAQSELDLKRIKELSSKNVEFIGNLKLSNNVPKLNNKTFEKKYSLMIVSSHEREEEIILKNIVKIIKQKKIKSCIAPRHPERILNIINILKKYNLSYKLESKFSTEEKDITIIDSFGNLDTYFYNTDIVFIGGSLINKGGHNPIEPAMYGCALISGNYVYNWKDIYDEMVNNKACIIVKNENELSLKINELFSDKILLANFKKNALNFSKRKFFDNEILFNDINHILN